MEENYRLSEIWVNKFDEDSAHKFRESVAGAIRGDPMRPIIIYIDSYGGAVDSLANMIETLDQVSNPIVTVCMGKAMSCGAILLSHGDIRFCGPHSRIMVHEVSSGTFGDVHDMHADVQETRRLNEYFMGLLARNCGFKNYNEIRQLIKEQDGRDRYMDANDALKFGIIDIIGTPRITHSLTYEVSVLSSKSKMKTIEKTKPSKKAQSDKKLQLEKNSPGDKKSASKTNKVKKTDSKKITGRENVRKKPRHTRKN